MTSTSTPMVSVTFTSIPSMSPLKLTWLLRISSVRLELGMLRAHGVSQSDHRGNRDGFPLWLPKCRKATPSCGTRAGGTTLADWPAHLDDHVAGADRPGGVCQSSRLGTATVTAKPGQNDFCGVWRTAKVLLYSPALSTGREPHWHFERTVWPTGASVDAGDQGWRSCLLTVREAADVLSVSLGRECMS